MKKYVYSANDFTGGINKSRPEYLIGDNELVQLVNCTFENPGVLTSRLGSDKYNSTAIPGATKMPWAYRFYDKDGSTTATLVAVNGASSDELYLGTDATGALSKITTGSALTKGKYYDAVAWKDQIFITNGTDNIQVWESGTTTADLTMTPSGITGKYIELHKERLFLAGNGTNPSRLYYTDTGDEEAWGANNYIDIAENDNGIIMNIIQLGQWLLVFKNSGVYRVFGNSLTTFEMSPLPGFPGLIAPRSAVRALGGVIWLSRDGIFYYDGANLTDLNSQNIESLTDAIDGSDLEKVFAYYADEKYFLWYPDDTAYNNTCLVYDFHTKGWAKYTGLNIASMMWWNSQDDDGEIYGGDSNGGYLYKLFTGYNDCGSDINVCIETKHIDGGDPNSIKHWKGCHFNLVSYDGTEDINLTPIFDIDQNQTGHTVSATAADLLGSTFILGTSLLGAGGVQRERIRLRNPGKSRYLGFQLDWKSNSQRFKFRGFEVEYNVLPSRR
jgi:hypothetical protein